MIVRNCRPSKRTILCGVLAILCACGTSAEVIRIGIGSSPGSSYQPYMVSTPETQSISGLAIDILNAVIAITGDTLRIVYLPGPRLFAGITDGTIDLDLFSNPEWRKEYAKDSLFTVPYLYTSNVLVVRKDFPLHISSIEDLKGQTLLLVNGFHYVEVDDLIAKGTILRDDAPSTATLLKMLDNKHGQVGIVDKAVYQYLIKDNDIKSLSALFETSTPTPVSMRFPKRSSAVVARFNAAIELLKKNGSLKKILARYGL